MVEWTDDHQARAEAAAHIRFNRLRTQGHRFNRPAGHHDLDTELQAAAAELWVAIYTGVDDQWEERGVRDSDGIDVAPDIGVRWSKYPNPHLIVHLDDPPDLRYVLVSNRLPDLRIRGWAWGHEAQDDKYWPGKVPGRPGFWVPCSDLRPFNLGVPA